MVSIATCNGSCSWRIYLGQYKASPLGSSRIHQYPGCIKTYVAQCVGAVLESSKGGWQKRKRKREVRIVKGGLDEKLNAQIRLLLAEKKATVRRNARWWNNKILQWMKKCAPTVDTTLGYAVQIAQKIKVLTRVYYNLTHVYYKIVIPCVDNFSKCYKIMYHACLILRLCACISKFACACFRIISTFESTWPFRPRKTDWGITH